MIFLNPFLQEAKAKKQNCKHARAENDASVSRDRSLSRHGPFFFFFVETCLLLFQPPSSLSPTTKYNIKTTTHGKGQQHGQREHDEEREAEHLFRRRR